jgi:hypothetical protein
MVSDEPRCSHCGEDREDMLDKMPRPQWASADVAQYFCNVCGRPFLHWLTPQGAPQGVH